MERPFEMIVCGSFKSLATLLGGLAEPLADGHFVLSQWSLWCSLCTCVVLVCIRVRHLTPVTWFAPQHPDRIFLILEYCAGGDLSEYIRRNGRVPESIARHFLRQLGKHCG